MDKQTVINTFREAILNNSELKKAIFGNDSIPEQLEDTVLTLSSLDFVDLIIEVENCLQIEFSDCMVSTKISIGELAERIADYV